VAGLQEDDMKLTVANISTGVSDAALQKAIAAIGKQVANEFQAEWGATADLVGLTQKLPEPKAPIQGDPDAIIYLGDSSQDPTTGVQGALGYHGLTHANLPYGFVYLDIAAEYGEDWETTLSHETLELLADPNVDSGVKGPAPRGHGQAEYDLEVCDPTQGDTYPIDGVVVSNFVGRAYFELAGGSGNTNYLKLALAPFGVRPNGYFQYEDANGRVHQKFGPRVTQQQKAAKEKLGPGRRLNRHKHLTPAR
jgi:hypothetical protein